MKRLLQRKFIYDKLSASLKNLDTKELESLLERSQVTVGWGINHILELNDQKVFLKRVPLTTLEFKNQYSTKNLFNLPMSYQYGVGSAGFGVFRELDANLKTTQWVLSGDMYNFPLMYHHRIIKKMSNNQDTIRSKPQSYFEYWNNDSNVIKYVKAREEAQYEVLLFMEHIPYTLQNWIGDHQPLVNHLASQMRNMTNFLWDKGLIHMDAHFSNILSDGQDFFLTDFGLVLDKSFDLNPQELDFLDRHKNYDFNEFLGCLTTFLMNNYAKLKIDKKRLLNRIAGISHTNNDNQILISLLNNLDKPEIYCNLSLDNNLLQLLKTYQQNILYMNDFFKRLRNDSTKAIRYDSTLSLIMT